MGMRYHKDADRVRVGLRQAFASLRKQGFFARMNHTCCQSCGWAEVPDGTENVVFFHRQDAQQLDSAGECWLAWGGNGQVIQDALQAAGLVVHWDGSANARIKVTAPEVRVRDIIRV